MFDHCMYFNTAALARRLEQEWALAFKPFDLAPPQAFMLRAVLETPGALQFELADVLAISRPTATRALHGLAAKKMIVRCKLRLIFCAESSQTQPFHPIQRLIFRTW